MEKPPNFIPNVYEMFPPQQVNIIFDSPHSGTIYPPDFAHTCPLNDLKQVEDTLVDDLYQDAAAYIGAGFLRALFPRTYVDVNRSPDDIDPIALRNKNLPTPMPTQRALAGHGVIHTYLRGNIPIYDKPIDNLAFSNRIETYYYPYHSALEWLMTSTRDRFGSVFHINCHSMNATALASVYPYKVPDIILGDMDGESCSVPFRRALQKTLSGMGYNVVVNVPYKGAEILKRYGRPQYNQNSLQIEINKDLYLNKDNSLNINRYQKLKNDITSLTLSLPHTLKSIT